MKNNGISEYFEEVEVEVIKEYDGYFCSVAEAITIVILGSICPAIISAQVCELGITLGTF